MHTQQRQVRTASTDNSRRRRNPTVASYLGLGDSEEPVHLVKYAPMPDEQLPPQQSWKHRVTRTGEKPALRMKTRTSKRASKQRHISMSSCVTKPSDRLAGHRLNGLTDEHFPSPAAMTQRQQARHTNPSQDVGMGQATASQIDTSTAHAPVPCPEDEDDFGQLCFDFDITTDDATNTGSAHTSVRIQPSHARFDDGDFDDDLMDADLLEVTTDTDAKIDCSSPQLDSSPTESGLHGSFQHAQMPVVSPDTSFVLDDERRGSDASPRKFISPVTLTTRLIAATGDALRKPIVRPPFPTAVSDRSPIIGLSSNNLLRSCFRVGEAISQSCHAVNAGNKILIELYARVLNSERDNLHQRFTFCDLFHAKPPYIQAYYAAAIWKSVQLFEYDSTRLMQQGRICRCIGTIKRNGKDWNMTVLNIWEATWDDVQWVEGIVNS